MSDLQSLKNPQRLSTVAMFLAVFISAIGPEALGQTLPFIPQVTLTGLVTACAWYIAQYNSRTGVESRVERAEELKAEEVISNLESDYNGC